MSGGPSRPSLGGSSAGPPGASLRRLGWTLAGRLLRLFVRAGEGLGPERLPALGAVVGRTWLRLHGPRTGVVQAQLARAFPDRDPTWVAQRTEGVFVHLGRGLAELVVLAGRRRGELLERVSIDGLEHLEEARRRSPTGGVLIVTAHLGNWELAAARVAELGVPLTVVHRGLGDRGLDTALQRLRAPGDADFEQLRMGRAGLGLVRALDAGRGVLVLLDQNARRHEGLFVSFFGAPACTRSGPLRLAARAGVPLVPAFVRREPDGRHHRIRIDPALELEAGAADDEEALRRDLQRVTAAIEAAIRESPEQWIWTHRRWRTRPEGLRGEPSS